MYVLLLYQLGIELHGSAPPKLLDIVRADKTISLLMSPILRDPEHTFINDPIYKQEYHIIPGILDFGQKI